MINLSIFKGNENISEHNSLLEESKDISVTYIVYKKIYLDHNVSNVKKVSLKYNFCFQGKNKSLFNIFGKDGGEI